MDWGKVGKGIMNAAPLIGGLLTNPLGTIADQAGKLLSKEFGCEDNPEALSAAIKADPNAMVKVKEIQSRERIELARIHKEAREAEIKLEVASIEAGSTDISNVNLTMREEAGSSDPWSRRWRPFWGFCSAGAFFIAVGGIMFLAYYAIKSGKAELLGHIPSLITALAMLFGVPGAILGVASWHRGQMQRIKAGEVGQPGILGAIANRIKR